MTLSRVEVDAGRGGDAELGEPGRGQIGAVVGEVIDIGVDVERPIGRGDAVDPCSGQAVEQDLAVGGVAGDVGLKLVDAVEGTECGVLAHRGRGDGCVLGEAFHRRNQIGRQQQPAQPPAGHREVLGEAVHHDSARAVCRSSGCLGSVGDAVIDLVGDQPHAGVMAPAS